MNFFENVLETSAKVADKVAKVTGEYIEKGKEKITELSLENELSKAYKQLGSLVYAMHKSGETNEDLFAMYIDEIAEIENKLEELRAEAGDTYAEPVTPEVVKYCPSCGTESSVEDSFCKHCGNAIK